MHPNKTPACSRCSQMSRESQPWQTSLVDQLAQQAVLENTHVPTSKEKASIKEWTTGVPAHPVPHHKDLRNV